MSSVIKYYDGIKSVAVIGNYLPRQCGIATFTTDLVEGLSAADPDIYNWAAAMNDKPDGYAYIDIFSGDSDGRRVLPGLAAFVDDTAKTIRRRGSKAGGTLHTVCPRGYEEDRSLIPKVW